jgi:hypothetical protein
MTVGELLDRMSSAEMTEWAALIKLENEEAAHQSKVTSSRTRMRR